jgi:mediator of RNA polymerase II transcription subunit 6
VQNALEYFMQSQFFDRTSNNAVIRMQTRFNQSLQEIVHQLSQMVGIEYVLAHVQEPVLYIVRKQRRHSPTDVEYLNSYYILESTIYQAPSLYDVLYMRLATSMFHLGRGVEILLRDATNYQPSTGYQVQSAAAASSTVTPTQSSQSSQYIRQRIAQLLADKIN